MFSNATFSVLFILVALAQTLAIIPHQELYQGMLNISCWEVFFDISISVSRSVADLRKRNFVRKTFDYITGRNWPVTEDNPPLPKEFVERVMFGGRIHEHTAAAAELRRNPDLVTMKHFREWIQNSRKDKTISSPRAVMMIREAERAIASRRI